MKMVLSPDARKMPPPTRLGRALSLTALASAKSMGAGRAELDGAIASGDGMLAEFKEREDTAFNISEGIFVVDEADGEVNDTGSDCPFEELDSAFVFGKILPEVSMILMGTSRRRGAETGSEET